MDNFLAIIEKINSSINGVVWGVPMLILIVGTGIIMTVGTKFFQVTRAKHVTKETLGGMFTKKDVRKSTEQKSISQFQALCTALAATIGTGNIAGVATAIAIGGPGAVFWMWVSAFFGMMTNYSENVLGIYYRRKNKEGEWCGGAMYYLRDGLGSKKGCKHLGKILAVLFSTFCVCASFGIGNMTQVNSIASAMKSNFGMPAIAAGIALAIIAALVIVGGIKRIGQTAEKLVPFMALFYIIGALIIFVMNFHQIPYIFSSIFKNAFNFGSIAGAGSGLVIKKAVTMGFKRGVFSNEAGLGSSVMVHSASNVKEPVTQGIWGIFEVFVDTIIVCTLTAFVLLSSTCTSVSLSEAVKNVTKEEKYVRIYDIDEFKNEQAVPLMDVTTNPLLEIAQPGDEVSDTYKVIPENGEPFEISLKKDDESDDSNYIYTNVMSIKGISVDENGNEIKDENAPVNAVSIEQISGVPLVTYAFSQRFGSWAGMLLAVAILLFAFSTVLGWSYYGTKAWEYLFGTKSTVLYKVVFVLFIIVGATMDLGLAWDISDTLNGLMAIPNLIGVLALSKTVFEITKNYSSRKLYGKKDVRPMLSAFKDIQEDHEKSL